MNRLLSLLLGITLLFCTGCSALKASPAPDSGFIDNPELLTEEKDLPYHGVWRKKDIDRDDYDTLHVAPVNIEYLEKTSDWSIIKALSREEILQEAEELAVYFREQLQDELKEAEVDLVAEPDDRSVVLEVAIVELVPTNVVRSAAGNVAGIFVPGGGILSAGTGGSIAIEGKYFEAQSGEELALFKDREQAKIAPLDLAGLTAFQHARNSIDDWIEQIVKIITSPRGTPVRDSSPFRLSPW